MMQSPNLWTTTSVPISNSSGLSISLKNGSEDGNVKRVKLPYHHQTKYSNNGWRTSIGQLINNQISNNAELNALVS